MSLHSTPRKRRRRPRPGGFFLLAALLPALALAPGVPGSSAPAAGLQDGEEQALAGPLAKKEEAPALPRLSPAELQRLLGIPVYPGATLVDLEGPSRQVVDLGRPGWEFVEAEVVIADFCLDGPLESLREFYRPLTERDALLLLVARGSPPGELVALHLGPRHPYSPRQHWLRLTRFRRMPPATGEAPNEPHSAGR